MDHGSQPRSRVLIFFFLLLVYITKIRSHAETPMPKFHFDLSVRLMDTGEKQVPAKLKSIVVCMMLSNSEHLLPSHSSCL